MPQCFERPFNKGFHTVNQFIELCELLRDYKEPFFERFVGVDEHLTTKFFRLNELLESFPEKKEVVLQMVFVDAALFEKAFI